MFNEPQFWVGLSFVLLVVFAYKPVGRALGVALDSRAAKIQKELDEALRLKEEAQALLASYQRKQKEVIEESSRILKNAEDEANRIIDEAEKNLEEMLNKKIQVAMQKIANYEQAVVQELRTNSINMAVNTVRTLIKESIDKDISEQLVMQALAEMNKKLH